MRVIDKLPSREPCAESGWYAWDFLLDAPMDDAFIRSMRPLGSLAYLSMLAKPFFKVESTWYLIKGLRGDRTLRVAVHDDHREELSRIEGFLNGR